MSGVSRRDFLKLAGLLSGGMAAAPMLRMLPPKVLAVGNPKNILFVLFDAWSARHISTYGYQRETTPNITRLAEQAIVYHNHHAGGNFTTPGTASLLTGVLPWMHRAFEMHRDMAQEFSEMNIFSVFDDYHRIAYSHNPLVNTLFNQFQASLDEHIPVDRLLLTHDGIIFTLFHKDEDVSSLSWARTAKWDEGAGYNYSLFFSALYQKLQTDRLHRLGRDYPLGLPFIRVDNYFLLQEAIDYLAAQVDGLPQPFLGYFHFIPPHSPYRPHGDFYDKFKDDGYRLPQKPEGLFSMDKSDDYLLKMCTRYDEYILNLDHEFGRFFQKLEESGILENTWVILTSDHGELFERGILGHTTNVLYEPVIHVPLMIFEPGRRERLDIHDPTSAVDLLPTLLHLADKSPAAWTEGLVLPPFASPPLERVVYSMEARDTLMRGPLTRGSISQVKGHTKLIYFFGYPELKGAERVELYDLEADSEELHDLSKSQPKLTRRLLDELKAKLAEVNKPYL